MALYSFMSLGLSQELPPSLFSDILPLDSFQARSPFQYKPFNSIPTFLSFYYFSLNNHDIFMISSSSHVQHTSMPLSSSLLNRVQGYVSTTTQKSPTLSILPLPGSCISCISSQFLHPSDTGPSSSLFSLHFCL